ncbi:hypothetical protein FZEAL_8550 [Fusarium zealandicum]|uniref:Uncharacterized protein n=1 Tax=Fusarium zealandicum TaxID=1053134 RepID=A0A8H4UEM7_9HYPO|nr:hypothetical protein FZEAL_8550 [Fusarium zealandicum]
MRFHNNVMRILMALAACTTCSFILFTAFRIKIGTGVAISQTPERPLSYNHPYTKHPSDDDDDDNNYDDDDEKTPHNENDDYRILVSTRSRLGFFNRIDVRKTGYQIMNPTLLELPRNSSKHDFLIIARTLHVKKTINGNNYKLARQVAMFANLTYNNLGQPILKSNNRWSKLLVQNYGSPEHHCQNEPLMDKYIGPEDMKLFWTRKGEPLLIFTHQVDDENLCQGQFLMDVRAAVPELVTALGEHYANRLPPIRFKEPTGLRRQAPPGEESHPRYQREKNWAPAQSPFSDDPDELLFMVEPGQPFRWTSEDGPVQSMASPNEQKSAVEEPFPRNARQGETWHSSQMMTCMHDVMKDETHVHQSTPMLSLTLCKRGTCSPDEDNTVMLGMVQHRLDPPLLSPSLWYDRRIAVYSAVPPYKMMSVGKKLTYHGESDGRYAWTGSMVYFANQTQYPPSSHGFLDDEVWLSFGIRDAAAGWIDVKARDLVADHYLCQRAPQGYRDNRQLIEA